MKVLIMKSSLLVLFSFIFSVTSQKAMAINGTLVLRGLDANQKQCVQRLQATHFTSMDSLIKTLDDCEYGFTGKVHLKTKIDLEHNLSINVVAQ